MIKRRILLISPYPIKNPQHGGQKRVKAIFDYYKTIFTDVRFVSIFPKNVLPDEDLTAENIQIEHPSFWQKNTNSPHEMDVFIGASIATDPYVRNKLLNILETFKPDAVQIENTFLFSGLEGLLDDVTYWPRLEKVFLLIGLSKFLNLFKSKPKIIVSTQNVEYQIKKDILDSTRMSIHDKEKIVNRIRVLEEHAMQRADRVIAVSESDASIFRKLGAKKCIVAPNGIEKIRAKQKYTDRWAKYKKENAIDNLILFVGSEHPPNWTGFLNMMGKDMSFIPSNARLLFVGGVSNYFIRQYPKNTTAGKKFWSSTVALGRISEDELNGLLEECSVILLPITGGGGSNLKTAEAILADKKIIATPFAFRAFEEYIDLPNIQIAKNQKQFKESLAKAMHNEIVERTSDQQKLAERVQWEYCLKPLKKHLF